LKSRLLRFIIRFARENVLKFLVGNKSDLTERRKVSEEEGNELGIYEKIKEAKEFNMPFMETSAKENINIEDLFKIALETYMCQLNTRSAKRLTTSFKNNPRGLSLERVNFEKNDYCCIKFS